jgi:hypothetical protein
MAMVMAPPETLAQAPQPVQQSAFRILRNAGDTWFIRA